MDRGVELPVVNVTAIFRTLTWEREVLQVKSSSHVRSIFSSGKEDP